jgi:hypothetical protein
MTRSTIDRRAFGRCALGAAGALAALPAAARSDGTLPEAARPSGGTARRTLVGTYGGSGCDGVPAVAAFERWLGRDMDLVLDFVQFREDWTEMLQHAEWMARCWREAGRTPVVSVPMLVEKGGRNVSLRRGAAGAYDAHFRRLAEILVAAGYGGVIIRLGWEFNGDWYVWSAGGKEEAFIGHWRRIVATMRAVPGARFAFDWNPNLASAPVAARAYPGDDVVDFIGLDAYNHSWPAMREPERRWRYLMEHTNGLRWHRDFAAARGKPRSFAEWGTGSRADGHGGGDDPLYVRNMLAWMREGEPVAYHCYWNYPDPTYDALLTNGRWPRAAAALRAGLRANNG